MEVNKLHVETRGGGGGLVSSFGESGLDHRKCNVLVTNNYNFRGLIFLLVFTFFSVQVMIPW